MASSTELELSSAEPQFYDWTFPGAPLRIRLKLEIVAPLLAHLMPSFGADPERPAEAGGVLLGNVHADKVEVTGFEPFLCEPREDGHFVIGENDHPRFKDFLQRWTQPGSTPGVVGYFRSQVREGLRLNEEDIALIEAFFADPGNVYLIVQPSDAEGSPVGGFFFSDTGTVFADCTFMPFPFDPALLTRESKTALMRAREERARPEAVVRVKGSSSLGKRSVLLALAAVLALSSVFAVLLLLRTKSPPAAQASSSRSPVALSVARTGTDLTVTWNSAAPAVKDARVGVLTIQDGPQKREVPLTPAMLLDSRIVFTPASDAIHVALELFTPDGRSRREELMFLFSRSAAANPPSVVRAQTPLSVTIAVPAVRKPVEASRAREPERPARRFELPSVARGAAANPSIPDAAPAESIGPGDPYLTGRNSTVLAQIPLPKPAAPPEPAPVAPAPVERPASSQPAPPQRPPSVVVPPKPLQQVRPELPPNVRGMLSQEVQVEIKVTVDANGRVTRAEPVASKGAIAEYLGKAAATAALVWKFEPARIDGKPAPGELILQFRFAPDKRKW
jgi:TonB family protein